MSFHVVNFSIMLAAGMLCGHLVYQVDQSVLAACIAGATVAWLWPRRAR